MDWKSLATDLFSEHYNSIDDFHQAIEVKFSIVPYYKIRERKAHVRLRYDVKDEQQRDPGHAQKGVPAEQNHVRHTRFGEQLFEHVGEGAACVSRSDFYH